MRLEDYMSRRAIRRLRLREGDVVLVRDSETLRALMETCREMSEVPPCPIVVAPEGVHRLSREYLQRLLAGMTPNRDLAGNVGSGDVPTTHMRGDL
jgi:hypothetical protein